MLIPLSHGYATSLSIVTEHLSPFQIVTKDKKITGFATEVVEESLERVGVEYTLKANAWAQTYAQALNKPNTCVYSLARTPEREKKFIWVGKIATTDTYFYSLAAKNINLNNFDEAYQYRVAAIRDDVSHQFLLSKGFVENQNLYVADNYDGLVKLLDLRKGSIDLIILNESLLKNRSMSDKERAKYKKGIKLTDLSLQFYLACNLNTPKQLTTYLSSALMSVKHDGTYQAIKTKWSKYIESGDVKLDF